MLTDELLRYSFIADLVALICFSIGMFAVTVALCIYAYVKRHAVMAKLRGRNTDATPISVIREQMGEPRALPMGRQEFEDWSDRIIAGAMVSATTTTQKWTLANMLLHIGPTESHKPDAHYIHALRVCAIKEAAHLLASEYRDKGKAERAALEAVKAEA